nr:hypothetical protein [Tanacetum cinerariifolium]
MRGSIRNKESRDEWSHYSRKYVAFQPLGDPYPRTTANGPWRSTVSSNCSRTLYKIREAKPITVKNARQVEKFAYEYVLCRFGVPRIISSKEEKHFKEGIFADFCKGLKITQSFSPITKNMEIMHDIEKQLVRSQQSCVDILAKELWLHRTLPGNSQKETPFSLTYRSEAVVPIVEATDDREERKKKPRKARK